MNHGRNSIKKNISFGDSGSQVFFNWRPWYTYGGGEVHVVVETNGEATFRCLGHKPLTSSVLLVTSENALRERASVFTEKLNLNLLVNLNLQYSLVLGSLLVEWVVDG